MTIEELKREISKIDDLKHEIIELKIFYDDLSTLERLTLSYRNERDYLVEYTFEEKYITIMVVRNILDYIEQYKALINKLKSMGLDVDFSEEIIRFENKIKGN